MSKPQEAADKRGQAATRNEPTEIETIGTGEVAAQETGDYIAWVYSAVVEALEPEGLQPKCSLSGGDFGFLSVARPVTH